MWTDSTQATVRPAGWSDSTRWARANSEGIWVEGSVRPKARWQFLNFFHPERVLLNRQSSLFECPASHWYNYPNSHEKAAHYKHTFILLTSKQHHCSNWRWYAWLKSTSTVFVESWESGFFSVLSHRLYQMLWGRNFLFKPFELFRLPLSKSLFCLLYCGNISIFWDQKIMLRFLAIHVDQFFFSLFLLFLFQIMNASFWKPDISNNVSTSTIFCLV